MRQLIWLVALAIAAGLGYWAWRGYRRWAERKLASEQRFASFIAQAMPAAQPADTLKPVEAIAALPQQKLLYEAAAKAGEAGEAALSIQLYARLLARYPGTVFAAQARAAVETQKKKLAKP